MDTQWTQRATITAASMPPDSAALRADMSPPRNGRRTPEYMTEYVIDGTPPAADDLRIAPNNPFYQSQAGPSVQQHTSPRPDVPPKDIPPRTATALSGATTIVRNPSERSRSSIAKMPLEDIPATVHEGEPAIRSIFPQYDHTLPFDQQHYFPTQTSPTHIPRTVISRQSHVPQQIEPRSPPIRSPVRSPMSAGSASAQRWPRRQHEPPVIPPVNTTEELRDFWKAANGWKASSFEGRTFCMKLLPEKDAPVYTLTSRTQQPLYHMRLDPTSASAYVTLSRHDPNKPCKDTDPLEATRNSTGLLSALREAESKQPWQEAIATTLEEPARRLPPNDGLVALLYPSAAARVAIDKPHDLAAVAAAERECARLVWDEDSANYFLVHPAVATPFCITIERSPAWSRTEYTIEHIESPQHLGRLTRDGTGEGWMELDTLVAGRVESYYVLDVAAAALLLVARIDEKNVLVEQFAPPPAAHVRDAPSPSSFQRTGSRLSTKILGAGKAGDKGKNKKAKKRGRFEAFELDLESQASSLGGKLDIKESDRDKLPGVTRTIIKLLGFAFKCVIWALTLAFKAAMAIIVGLTKCITREKF
ncbi:putative acetylserotonin methytransferase-like protein [Rosellinia necatrix]|uniref:Putative acetylserotonin methytransferase-like protein n=1 Tax=Rosellinia necatrix TaxID=77044 RepID=A0A1W2TSU6_ROSNE|nr:putative acetylserotonin methytransferase-like protein [Rosellinia necatrix]